MELGNIIFSDSFQEVQMALSNNYVVVALVDHPEQFGNIPNFYPMANLLPPMQAVVAEIDGDKMMSDQIYAQYLSTPEPTESVSAILAAIVTGVDIMIYIPYDENKSFGFAQVFADVFENAFGIRIGSTAAKSLFTGAPEHMSAIANVVYTFNNIPFEVYCDLMPVMMAPSPDALTKMLQQFPYHFATLEEAISFCISYIAQIKNQLNVQRMTPKGERRISPAFKVDFKRD